MAKKKAATKKVAPIKKALKKQVKKNSFKLVKVFIFLVVLAILAAIGTGVYTHFTYNETYIEDLEGLYTYAEELKEYFPDEVTDNLDFTEFLTGKTNYSVTIIKSSSSAIDITGVVARPIYSQADQEVELTILLEVKAEDFLQKLYYNILGHTSIEVKITLTVLKQVITDSDLIDFILDDIFVPEFTTSNIGLLTEVGYNEDIIISWSSSASNIINNFGVINNLGTAILTVDVSLDDISRSKEFEIEVIDEFAEIIVIDEDFEELKLSSSYATDDTVAGVFYHQAVIGTETDNKFLRLRAVNDAYFELVSDLRGLNKVSFDLWAVSSSSFSKDVYVYLEVSYDGVNYDKFYSIKILDNNVSSHSFDFSSISETFNLRIKTFADYATMDIAIDNLVIKRSLNEEDVEKEFIKIIPSNINRNINLPLSTPYGGKVSWESSNPEYLNVNGLINRQNESKKVILTATITEIFGTFIIEVEVYVVGLEYVLPVEIFFIDIGKYGTADSGESIYFKIGAIDILVDAGDNFAATKQAISEVIDENSEDGIIDYVIATHPDSDHIGGMEYIFQTYDILNVIYFEGTHTSQVYSRFAAAVANEETLVTNCTAMNAVNNVGDCKSYIELAPNISIEIIDTGYYNVADNNGRSVVFVFEAYGTRVLMTGDADNELRNIEASYMNKVGDIDVLKMVHHGTRNGTTTEFLNVVDPEYAIVTNGSYLGNKHGHPTHEAINRIYSYDSNIFIYAVTGGGINGCESTTSYKCDSSDSNVDRNGTIRLFIDNNGFSFSNANTEEMIELSATQFWINHPNRLYSHGG